VLASTANVPCIVLEYQPKCRDFAASIDWEHYTIRTNALTADKLIDKVGVLVDELPFAKRRLFQNVSGVGAAVRRVLRQNRAVDSG
jgi:polysaccharide pyruvyl transferase WcaK-like protein